MFGLQRNDLENNRPNKEEDIEKEKEKEKEATQKGK
jgi:hypothetical protein